MFLTLSVYLLENCLKFIYFRRFPVGLYYSMMGEDLTDTKNKAINSHTSAELRLKTVEGNRHFVTCHCRLLLPK
ncbi:hypothetical protein OESDEN_11354 [Oesophagostomum dentatum]|uniref:Uncharacterized protein n=1 Tax=Oesophagostomum dentatum TaxID=61180 RepID=A0A0B1SV50_OESDE|nr:hypothetical protein OESDEN_11354 [Oesophagostomum dentatum]